MGEAKKNDFLVLPLPSLKSEETLSRSCTKPHAGDVDIFKEMIDKSLQGIIVHRHHRPLYVNSAWAALHGFSIDEIMAMRSVRQLLHRDDEKCLRRHASDRPAGGHPPTRCRYRANHRSGRSIWLEVFVGVIDWQGERAIQCTVIDVDAQERHAEQLRQEQQSIQKKIDARTEALEKSRDQLHLHKSIIDQMSERISVIGTDYRYQMTNQANLKFWRRGHQEMIGHPIRDVVDATWPKGRTKSNLDRCFAGETVVAGRAIIGPDGNEYQVEIKNEPFRNPEGKITGAIVSVHDVTEAKEAKEQLRLFASVVEQVSVRISVIGRDYCYRLTNQANLDYHRKPIGALLKRGVAEIVGEQDFFENSKPELDRCFAGETIRSRRIGIDGAGEQRMLDILLEPYREPDGTISGAVVTLRDVTDAHNLSEQLAYHANHDELTGLINRRAFEQHLKAAIRKTEDNCRSAAFCFIDLDQFKIVNDTVGHLVGDLLLQHVARLLSGKIRDGDVLARLGGDEFGLLLHGSSLRRARRAAQNLVNVLNEDRFFHDGHVFEVGASVGIAVINRYTQDLNEVMSQADLACYAAKDNGRNRVHIYQKRDVSLRRRREEMVRAGGIRSALDQGRFTLFAQPISAVDTNDGRPGRVEILLRMLARNGDMIMPSAFIPAAERYGFMAEIDRWVIEHTLSHLASRSEECPELRVNINISGCTLGGDSLLDFIQCGLERAQVLPCRICFEITETAAIRNLAQTQTFIETLKREGCRFALDDFGSGLSSLRYLKRLPVDFLKIDRSFIRDIQYDDGSRAMVVAIHRMARELGIQTVAEGAETRPTLGVLKELGVDFVQGFAVGRPVSLQ